MTEIIKTMEDVEEYMEGDYELEEVHYWGITNLNTTEYMKFSSEEEVIFWCEEDRKRNKEKDDA